MSPQAPGQGFGRRPEAGPQGFHDLSATSDPLSAMRATQPVRETGQEGAGNRPLSQLSVDPGRSPTSAEVIGIKDACDGVAGRAITTTLQTLVLLLRRVQVVVTADNLPGRDEGRWERPA